ncbi:enoyl-CoA hydratase/isomerase family protein [Spongiibacter sp.]|uniref:enoyl-CoA hydratase/isomerase family protein n=1 Tax=Spongiibacter sp. TaxID=2024860 RepID=UPI00356197C1
MSANYQSATDKLLSELKEGVLTISFNRPEAMNALHPEMLTGVAALVNEASADAGVSVVVLQGAGRAFSAGVDLKVLQDIEPAFGRIGDLFDGPAKQAYTAIRNCRVPVIAKVHGACFTGALELALHCDFIYTTDGTKFGDTHTRFGLRPTWGMSQTLSQAIGVRKAKELSYTARVLKGDEAERLGIANSSVAGPEELDDLVATRAAQIAGNSRAAVAAMKDLYRMAQQGHAIDDALAKELATEYSDILDTAERLAEFR